VPAPLPAAPWTPETLALNGEPAQPIPMGELNGPAPAPVAPSPPAAAPPAAPPAFDPSAIDGLYKSGHISREQYEQMGGQLPPNVRGPLTAPEVASVASPPPAAATGIREPTSTTRVFPPGAGVPYPSQGATAPAAAVPPVSPSGLSADSAIGLAARGMGGGPARVLPEHWQPTARTTQVHEGIHDPVAQQAFDDAAHAQVEAAKAGGEMAMVQLANDAAEKQRMALVDAANETQRQLLRDSQTSALAEQRGHIESLMRDASSQEINPGKWWDDKSTASKVATGIGMMLRGWVFGTTGRGDPAQWVNSQISNSVAAQQAKAAQSRNAVTDATNVYQMMRDKFGDDERAALASQLAQRQNIISGLEAQAASANLPNMQRLRAQQLAAQLTASQAQDRLAWDEKTADKVITSGQERFVPRQVAGGGPTDIVKLLKRAKEIKDLSDSLSGEDIETQTKRQALQKSWAETQAEIAKAQGAKVPKPPAPAVAERLASFDAALSNIEQIQAIRSAHGGGTLSPSTTAVLQGLSTSARAAIAHADIGRVTETEMKNYESLVPADPNAYSPTGSVDAQLATAKAYIQRSRKALQGELSGTPSVAQPSPEGFKPDIAADDEGEP
jgi:hypothetical protein